MAVLTQQQYRALFLVDNLSAAVQPCHVRVFDVFAERVTQAHTELNRDNTQRCLDFDQRREAIARRCCHLLRNAFSPKSNSFAVG